MVCFILFGTTKLTTKAETGQFVCPKCREQRRYQHKIVRRFLTVYFIPLIPLEAPADLYECQTCEGVFDRRALDRAPVKTVTEFHEDLRRVMALIVLADGVVDDSEVAAIQRIYQQHTGQDLSRGQLADEIRGANQEGLSASEYLRLIESDLGREGKRLLVQSAFLVASATGDLRPAPLEELKGFVASLRLSDAEFRRYIDEAIDLEMG